MCAHTHVCLAGRCCWGKSRYQEEKEKGRRGEQRLSPRERKLEPRNDKRVRGRRGRERNGGRGRVCARVGGGRAPGSPRPSPLPLTPSSSGAPAMGGGQHAGAPHLVRAPGGSSKFSVLAGSRLFDTARRLLPAAWRNPTGWPWRSWPDVVVRQGVAVGSRWFVVLSPLLPEFSPLRWFCLRVDVEWAVTADPPIPCQPSLPAFWWPHWAHPCL